MGRRAVQLVAMLLWAVLAFLTLYVLFTYGPGVLELLSILIVAILGVGVFGALGDDRR